MAIDLRENGLKHCVPENFFGNGSWSLQIEGGKSSSAELGSTDKDEEMLSTEMLEKSFCWAAQKIRSSLSCFRNNQDSPLEMLRSVRNLQESSLSSKVSYTLLHISMETDFSMDKCTPLYSIGFGCHGLLGNVNSLCTCPNCFSTLQVMVISETLLNYDAFMTSWQFPIWDIDFGNGGPRNFQGIMHPTPPFHGILYPAHPRDKGLSLDITVPTSAVQALQSSKVLKHLVPKAQFVS